MTIESPTLSPQTRNAHSPTSHSSDQPRFRCPQCSPKQRENSKESRNLIVCIDGTSNQFGQNNTNVVKLFAKIDLETSQPEQFAYYSSGIGTRPKSLHVFDRMERAVSDKFDMAVAWNMEEIVKDAYGWLAGRYQEGDKIYLFGFSRGAYQVRVLAGMIHEVGLIRTSTEKQIGTAYDHYESIRSGKPKTRQIAREFKNTFSWKGLRVHFVGVWDTVSSVGLIRGDVFLSTSSSAAHACHFRHALALDELRVKFMPEYFHEMNSEADDIKCKYVTPLHAKPSTTISSQQPESIVGNNNANLLGTAENLPTDDKSKHTSVVLDGKRSTYSPSKRPGSTVSDSGTSPSGTPENLQTDDTKSKRTDTTPSRHSKTPSSEQRDRGNGDGSSKDEHMAPDIKEVWFAGSHSDVGGRNRPGKSAQAGNASLLWMRREATLRGLVLQPTDVVWVPDDLDLGISDSMSKVWRCVEYFPIKHQVSFSGAGEDARRLHLLKPRRIIPGQKVHASILYANAYTPQATLGEGFDIPITQIECDDADLGNDIWETGLFDHTAAQELVKSLESQQGVAPVYLDRLLFMLRFKEGKQCVRAVDRWEDKFEELIENQKCAPLVRLVTMVAYYEASNMQNPSQPRKKPSENAFTDAKNCLSDILVKHKHRDGPRVVALLRPLTKHEVLRRNILSQNILDKLVELLDKIVGEHEGNFGQAMDGLNSLLRCNDTREFIIAKLKENPIHSNQPRIVRILKVENTRFQVAALRMVLTLAHSPSAEAKTVCSIVKPRIRALTGSKDRLVGLLAIEVWLALYIPREREQEQEHLNLRNALVRANLANALVRMNFNTSNSTEGQNTNVDPGQEQLRRIFGVGGAAGGLDEERKKLLKKLKRAVRVGNARERIAATLTLLKLCEFSLICRYLSEINLVDVFVKQLRNKDASLLAAYALATCLNYDEMKAPVRNNKDLPKYIVGMLQLDYFDDAIGQIEGFQIFGNIMRDGCLREKIKEYKIPEVLERKLGKGKPKDIRTSLICLDIFRSFDNDGSGALELVKKSLEHLRNPQWKIQKVGVTILSALAQTERGMMAIQPQIPIIVGMLLPEGYLPIPRESTSVEPTFRGERPTQAGTAESNDSDSSPSTDTFNNPPSWMMGPACALRILAQNKSLRDATHDTLEYGSLKHLFLSGTLVGEKDTSALRIGTPNRTDVTRMLDRMIKAIDGELSEDGLMSIGDAVLPHIRHWDRLVTVFRNRTLGALSILPGIVGVSVLAVLGVVTVTPIVLSVQAYGLCKRLWTRYRNTQFLDDLRDEEVDGSIPSMSASQTIGHDAIKEDEGGTGPREHDDNGSPGPSAIQPVAVPIQGSSEDTE